MDTIKINGENVKIGDALEQWEQAGICRSCIDHRLKMNRTFQDSYQDFAFLHDAEGCSCNY